MISFSRTAGEGGDARSAATGEGLAASTIGGELSRTSAALAAAGIDEPRRQSRRLLAAALDLSAAEIFAHPERSLCAADQSRIDVMLARMVAREPLSRIIGKREFWGLEFALSPDTLDPRPDSETLVETVLAYLPDRAAPYRFLDLGAGTGCLLLALLSEYRQAFGVGIDRAPGAAVTARRNAVTLGLAERAGFAVGDWGTALAGGFDAIVANPPYIPSAEINLLPPEVREHDPRRALDGGTDGLSAYRAIAADLPHLLRAGGFFAAEIGVGQAGPIAAILSWAGLRADGVRRDLAGIARVVVARSPA